MHSLATDRDRLCPGEIWLALLLGYAISWSVVGPVELMDARFREIASGNFSQRIEVPNQDELGALADNLNRMSENLDRLYQQIESRNRDLSESLEQQTVTSEILQVYKLHQPTFSRYWM